MVLCDDAVRNSACIAISDDNYQWTGCIWKLSWFCWGEQRKPSIEIAGPQVDPLSREPPKYETNVLSTLRNVHHTVLQICRFAYRRLSNIMKRRYWKYSCVRYAYNLIWTGREFNRSLHLVSRLRMSGVLSSLPGYLMTCMETDWPLRNISGTGCAAVMIWSTEIMTRTLMRQLEKANLQFSYKLRNYHLGDEAGYY